MYGNTFRKTEIENCKNEVEKIKKQIKDSTLEIQYIQEDIQNIKEDDGFRGGMSRELDRCIQHKKELKSILNKLELHLEELNLELKKEINTKLQSRKSKSPSQSKTRKSSQSPKPTTPRQSKTRNPIQHDDIVHELFGPNVTKKNKLYQLSCTGPNSPKFTIDKDIILHELIGCDDMTGKEILNKIIEIADRLEKNIVLSDSSYKKFGTMKCTYQLFYFYILLHGESWYNTFGFKSKTHEEDTQHNETVRHLPLHEYVQLAKEHFIERELINLDFECKNMNREPRHLYIEDIHPHETVESYKRAKREQILEANILDMDDFITTFGNRFTKTTPVSRIISDIFTHFIKKENPTSCDHKIKLLKQLIDNSKYVLRYNNKLTREPRTKSPF